VWRNLDCGARSTKTTLWNQTYCRRVNEDLPIFHIDSLIQGLQSIGVPCKRGGISGDVPETLRPYFERWLCNRDGFAKLNDSYIDYIGIEDVTRMGPFFDIFCLIQNVNIIASDENAHNLVTCYPQYVIRDGKIVILGWTGGLLSHYLSKDDVITGIVAQIPPGEEFAKLFVRAVDFACIVQTQVWEPSGLVSIYPLIKRIAINVKNLFQIVHLGERTEI
jgi:hypothetical protein